VPEALPRQRQQKRRAQPEAFRQRQQGERQEHQARPGERAA